MTRSVKQNCHAELVSASRDNETRSRNKFGMTIKGPQNALLTLFIIIRVISSPLFADINIENPWIRASSGPNAALFMTLVNTSDKSEKLKGAQIDVCAHTELHTHVEEKGVFRMREVETIEIPASGQTELKPGGHHVMLMKIHRPLKEGDEIPVTLSFDGGASICCVASVKGLSEGCCHKE